MDQARLTPFEAFDLAVTRAGGQSALARICDCTPGNINQLLQAQRVLPAEYVLKVEAATHVSRSDLRPDLYPRGLQDGVPFSPDSSAPTPGELSGATPEWPLPPSDDGEPGNRGDEIPRAAVGVDGPASQTPSAGMGPATPPGDQRTQPGGALSVGDAAAGTIGDSAAVDEAERRPAAALAAQGGR